MTAFECGVPPPFHTSCMHSLTASLPAVLRAPHFSSDPLLHTILDPLLLHAPMQTGAYHHPHTAARATRWSTRSFAPGRDPAKLGRAGSPDFPYRDLMVSRALGAGGGAQVATSGIMNDY